MPWQDAYMFLFVTREKQSRYGNHFLQNCQTFSIHFLFTLQYSAIIKNKINRILNKENNASNPREFGECIQKQGGISNVTVIMIFDLVKVNN